MRALAAGALGAAILPSVVAAQSPSPQPPVETYLCVVVTGTVPPEGFGGAELVAALASGQVAITRAGPAEACLEAQEPPASPPAPLAVGDEGPALDGTVTLEAVRFTKGRIHLKVRYRATASYMVASPFAWQLYVGDQPITWAVDPVPRSIGRELPDANVPAGRDASGWITFRASPKKGSAVSIFGPGDPPNEWRVTCCKSVP